MNRDLINQSINQAIEVIDKPNDIVTMWEISARKRNFLPTIKRKNTIAAKELLNRYDKDEIATAVTVASIARVEKWTGDWKFCPRVNDLTDLVRGSTFGRVLTFWIANQSQPSEVTEIK